MKKANIREMVLLLQKKLGYLQDFQNLNQEEWERINQGDISNLEAFYYDRELLLNAMDRIDKRLRGYNVDQCDGVNEESKGKVLSLLQKKRKAIYNILNQDMKIHGILSSSFIGEKNKTA